MRGKYQWRSSTEHPKPALLRGTQIRNELRGFRLEDLQSRNEKFFREEEEKLDRWAEDVKFALERELRELDTQIKAAKKTSKSAVALAEKLEAQKQIKTLEAKRNTKRRQLFDAQDEVDKKRAELIEEIERQLQTKTSIEPLFALRWTLRGGAGTTA
jgi:predicted  nucleic acid-binding Zn-ribbon protein